jgi:hypothetical protein
MPLLAVAAFLLLRQIGRTIVVGKDPAFVYDDPCTIWVIDRKLVLVKDWFFAVVGCNVANLFAARKDHEQ